MTLTPDDHVQIEQLAARYNQAIDLGDAEAWAACYTEDGEFSTEPGGETSTQFGITTTTIRGRMDLVDFAAKTAASTRFRHWAANRVLEGDATEVRAVSYMSIYYLEGPHAGELLTGVMRDELVRTDGEWRFRSRRIHFDT